MAFEAATGDGPVESGERRAAEVRVAFAGLLQIRRLTNSGAARPESVPAAWERARPVRAVALALEAAGVAASAVDAAGERTAVGYRVAAEEGGAGVRVEWTGPRGGGAAQDEERALGECARILVELGWDALVYRGPRGRRFVEVR
ncbi:hypothetical protein ABT160_21705 [Streptomyces sp. NPDC001941]|uniref:hypothetical protein n=1 Tax=Streptomyces sp. NPDC001941 TaxID=3154659 RepID=UPI003328B7A7